MVAMLMIRLYGKKKFHCRLFLLINVDQIVDVTIGNTQSRFTGVKKCNMNVSPVCFI